MTSSISTQTQQKKHKLQKFQKLEAWELIFHLVNGGCNAMSQWAWIKSPHCISKVWFLATLMIIKSEQKNDSGWSRKEMKWTFKWKRCQESFFIKMWAHNK